MMNHGAQFCAPRSPVFVVVNQYRFDCRSVTDDLPCTLRQASPRCAADTLFAWNEIERVDGEKLQQTKFGLRDLRSG